MFACYTGLGVGELYSVNQGGFGCGSESFKWRDDDLGF